MTHGSSTSKPGEAPNLLVAPEAIAAEFRTRLAASLEMLCGERVEVIEDNPPAGAVLSWRRHPLNTQPPSDLYTAAPEIIGRAIGARVLSAAGLDDFTDDDVAGSYAEVLQSALSAVAQFLSRGLGADIGLQEAEAFSREAEIQPDAGSGAEPFHVSYRLQFGEQALAPLCFSISPALITLLQPPPPTPAAAKAPELAPVTASAQPPTAAPAAAVHPAGAAVAPPAHDGDLGRILDLELPIRVSFGKAHVPLREVLKLSTGSIVELDRSIHEPVDIIVNDRVVGRGEVVVIEGNYGVRIQEIVSLGPA